LFADLTVNGYIDVVDSIKSDSQMEILAVDLLVENITDVKAVRNLVADLDIFEFCKA
jgi:hypothetical protein